VPIPLCGTRKRFTRHWSRWLVGRRNLIQALAAYERDMIRYGFAAVQTSLSNMNRFHAKGTLARTATKALFRVVDSVPPLKAGFLGR